VTDEAASLAEDADLFDIGVADSTGDGYLVSLSQESICRELTLAKRSLDEGMRFPLVRRFLPVARASHAEALPPSIRIGIHY
jgi:hypothetical protein